MLNETMHYNNGELMIDGVPAVEIMAACGTPVYVYSLNRLRTNVNRIRSAFPQAHIHYSAKANANLTLLKTLIAMGVGVDTVSAGEIYKALKAGCSPEHIVFAGVGKSPSELRFAVEQGIGWFNVENVAELEMLNALAAQAQHPVRVALRLNPELTASTHRHIATGHGGAKFGLTADIIQQILSQQHHYPHLTFAGLHIHIGSQLHETSATTAAVEMAVELMTPYPHMRTLNMGGGLPVAYQSGVVLPEYTEFADAVLPLLTDYAVMLEPGRSIVADAGVLLSEVLYLKEQAGHLFTIIDASMTELMRPALYEAHHEIVPLKQAPNTITTTVVGPVCETTDVLGRGVALPRLAPGDAVALLTAGAYGMVMASNYNARPRPPEVVVEGDTWRVVRLRETWDDLLRGEDA
ncbi:MAG: diaminopimelate decarboxylase [Anaerolineae bacterium]